MDHPSDRPRALSRLDDDDRAMTPTTTTTTICSIAEKNVDDEKKVLYIDGSRDRMGVSKEGRTLGSSTRRFGLRNPSRSELFDIEVNNMEQKNAPVVTEAVAEVKELSKRAKFRLQKVVVLVTTNPKKVGSESHRRFEDYFKLKGGETIDEVLRNTNVRMDDIMHDSKHGYIVIGDDEAIKAHHEKAEAARKAQIEEMRRIIAAEDAKTKAK